jgi:hypothetical protein
MLLCAGDVRFGGVFVRRRYGGWRLSGNVFPEDPNCRCDQDQSVAFPWPFLLNTCILEMFRYDFKEFAFWLLIGQG